MAERGVPADADVVVQQETRNGAFIYVLHISAGADQLLYRTRNESVAQAVAFANRQHVRAWFANCKKDFVLLATFSRDT